MIRTLPLIAVLAPLASGCIIYEDRHHKGEPCDGCTVETAPADPGNPGDPDPEPEPDQPQITDNLALTVNEANPGQTLLSTLVPLSQDIDLSGVVSVGFERDVEVLDTITRPYELVLLLAVDAEAELGDVEVFVETKQSAGWILAEPFHIVATAETGSETDPGCSPGGGSTTDTGCP